MIDYPKKSKNLIQINSYPKNIIYNICNGHEYYLGKKESKLFDMLDGKTDFNKLMEENNISEGDLTEILDYFKREGLIEGKTDTVTNIFRIRLVKKILFHEKYSKSSALIIQHLISFAFILSMLFIVFFITEATKNHTAIRFTLESMINVKSIILLLLSFFVSVFFHELNHAITAVANGAFAVETGIMLQYFLPCAYVSVCGLKNITNKGKIINILSSGCMANVILIGVNLFKCYTLNSISGNDSIFIIVNVSIIAMNCILFLRNDANQLVNALLNEHKNNEHKSAEEKVLTVLNYIVLIIGVALVILIKVIDHSNIEIKVLIPKLAVVILFNFLEVVSFSLKRPFAITVKYSKVYTSAIKICIIIIPLLVRNLSGLQFASVVFVSIVVSDFIYTLDVVISYYIANKIKERSTNG